MKKKKCFVIMSFDPKYDYIYKTVIKSSVEELNLECYRIDDDTIPKNIPDKIIREIIQSDLIIADISQQNPNVFYELGISHAIGNKTIIISQKLDNLPFDVRTEYTIGYTDNKKGLRLLYFELKNIIPKILDRTHEASNLVQIAGRDFFDFRSKIKENLQRIIEEGNRIQEFKKYLLENRKTDNFQVIRELANHVLKIYALSSRIIFVAICGAAGLGKTTLAQHLQQELFKINSTLRIGLIQTDAFMLNRTEREARDLSGYDPKANDIEKLKTSIKDVSNGEIIMYSPYNHNTGTHEETQVTVGLSDIVILDGIHSFHPLLVPLTQIRFFVYASPTDSKELRFIADLFERNYTVHAAFQHAEVEFQNYEKHILHYIKFADKVIQIDNYWRYYI